MKNKNCTLCPRECGADRTKKESFCKAGPLPTVAKVMLHPWEEPVICHGKGCGAIFFSCCTLRCIFCQNRAISREAVGEEMDADRLCDLFFRLEEKGASAIDLVSPTPYLKTLIPSLEKAKAKGLSIPTVYNSSGYEKADSIRGLCGLIDYYLPDFKYVSPALSLQFSGARDYAEHCAASLLEMHRQVEKRLIVRHLVLPGHTDDSLAVLDRLARLLPKDGFTLSLMRQYTPMEVHKDFPELARKLTTLEYQKVLSYAQKIGFETIYTQEKESASASFIPDFN